ncbi:hypothetical protein PCO82_08630 [Pectobacteriaceae bacterium CE90]|nr:hypothetical protein [Prodigiosinella sp. LS101]WJV52133.1 hypothetical protein PCO85_12795 [Prodigiosinella sp. LS101]WJV56491.1 hypothetical protein PCO84_12805 [Pectobacteriaceae bacterium C111]WJY16683.1 hypothetical protein PCO82_08630 [Pectobacteriaceae bacterium CE90]
MLMGTLKETLLFGATGQAGVHRYEIYKHEMKGGYFAIIYVQKTIAVHDNSIMMWVMENSYLPLKSNFVPNARMECEVHWQEEIAPSLCSGD